MRFLYTCIGLLVIFSCGNKATYLKKASILPDYPSASGIEYYNRHYYIVGDDAAYLLVLDSLFQKTAPINLYQSPAKRIPKEIKPDLEACSIIRFNDSIRLLLIGSGSFSPHRDSAVMVDLFSKQKKLLSLDTFYRRLKNAGITELNIEGLSSLPGVIVLANRGHKGFPKNHLIVTSGNFWAYQNSSPVNLIKFGSNDDSTQFSGVSGLAYARRSDKLIATVSTENTRSVYEDGTIGKSYLWIVDNISSKRRWKAINPNRVIDLEAADARFKGQKIESVCVTKETRHYIHLALVADNDDGNSHLFSLVIEKD